MAGLDAAVAHDAGEQMSRDVPADEVRFVLAAVTEMKQDREREAARAEENGEYTLALKLRAAALGLECAAECFSELLEPTASPSLKAVQ